MNADAPSRLPDDPAGAAIAMVLRAQRDAQAAVALARSQADAITERARADARALAERTERRIRHWAGAFDRELAARLARIEADADHVSVPHELDSADIEAVERAVTTLARELTRGAP